jgi:hypothetical protein
VSSIIPLFIASCFLCRERAAAAPGQGPLATGATGAQEPKRRGLFGFGKKRAAAQPAPAAGQTGNAADTGYARDTDYPREPPATGAGGAPGGAWAGSRLTQEEQANRANMAGRVSSALHFPSLLTCQDLSCVSQLHR